MKIERISSCRAIDKRFFWQIVFEWEDIFSREMGIPIWEEPKVSVNPHAFRLPILDDIVLLGKGNLFRYDLSAGNYNFWNNHKVLPCIIDFNLTKKKIAGFERAYSKHKQVLISSLEAYVFLKENNTRLPIAHLPLSISDKYKITGETRFEKKFDLVLMGRQNSVLMGFLKEYAKKHPDFVYVLRKDTKSFSYYTSTGELVGNIITREDYMHLTQQARCALYATQGIDGEHEWRNGYNQVTPRWLELIASGCHVIARYPENVDTKYYNMEHIASSCDSYCDFELKLDKARNESADMEKYSEYLSCHYSSNRVAMLKDILNKIS
ncbi:MAG: glycosyltransferase family 1 protein [Prevotella sp.]|nr:glycosyltransferase family 1 protein [Prevotella sp.]